MPGMIAHVPERTHADQQPAREAAAPATAGRATLSASVLTLQRQIGNAAVTRLLQRDATADAEELQAKQPAPASQRICATFVPSTATGLPQRLDPLDPLIGTVAGPCLEDWAGGYFWYVNYALPAPATQSGFIIQELYQQGSGGSSEHFWECWRVRSGDQSPTNRTNTPSDVSPAGAPYDDRYRHLNVPGASQAASGWYRHVGQARFYPGPLPSQFGADSPGVDSYITRQRPDGWTGAGTRHDCYAEWGSRPGGARYRGLVAFSGWREYRAGDTVNDSRPRPSFAPGGP
jgi:hypothetical protein